MQNLVQNLMNLVLRSKYDKEKSQKMAKKETVQKTTYMWHSSSKG